MEERSLRELLISGGLEEHLAARLASYGAAVLAANRRFNLTGAKSPQEICAQIVSSLELLPYVRLPLVDVGSGAGFPAIPLALASGGRLALIESNAKKARFLSDIVERLGIRADVICARAEATAHREGLREAFVCGTARAVAAATTAAELVLPFVEPGGVAVLPRGRVSQAERDALADAALILGGELEALHAAGSGGHIAIVRKKSTTPRRFPRRTGIPAKRPLCDVSRETHETRGGPIGS